jgi:citronellol/citronellal dehydrogenase
VDIRDDNAVELAVESAAEYFGGIDIVLNNASAIDLSPTDAVSMKSYDLMQDINARGAFMLTKLAIPYLRRADNPHVLTLSPPISLEARWFEAGYLAYSIAKYGMSLLTVGIAAQFRNDGIAANSLWPHTTIDTAAVRNVMGAQTADRSRTPEIMADAAHVILTKPSREVTGNFFVDDEVLADEGVRDFACYRATAGVSRLEPDLWMHGDYR